MKALTVGRSAWPVALPLAVPIAGCAADSPAGRRKQDELASAEESGPRGGCMDPVPPAAT